MTTEELAALVDEVQNTARLDAVHQTFGTDKRKGEAKTALMAAIEALGGELFDKAMQLGSSRSRELELLAERDRLRAENAALKALVVRARPFIRETGDVLYSDILRAIPEDDDAAIGGPHE